MRIAILSAALLLAACGPSAAERDAENAAMQAKKDCGRTYSSAEKVIQEFLWSKGVQEVKFIDKAAYVDKCVAMGLNKEQLACVDPNLAQGDESCKNLDDTVKAKVTELRDFMTSPMTEKPKPEEPMAEGGEAAGGEAAGGEAPADGAPPAEGGEQPAEGAPE